ncbi:MAG: hypothetical protein U0804_06170 [Gemmataceae bacterium]
MGTDADFILVRCAHCSGVTRIRRDVNLDDTQCPACGSYFEAIDLSTPAHQDFSEGAEETEFPVKLVAVGVVVASVVCALAFVIGHRQGRSDDARQLKEAQTDAITSRTERDQTALQRDMLVKDVEKLRKDLLASQQNAESTDSGLLAARAATTAKTTELAEAVAQLKSKEVEIEQLKAEVLFAKQLLDSTRAKLKAQERAEDIVALARAKASEAAFVRINEYRITAVTATDRLNVHSAFLILVRINDKHNKDQEIDLPKLTELATPSVMRECVVLVRIGGDALMENGKYTLGESWARALTPKK